MNEVWKDISGYEGSYQVSNLGRVKRLNVKDSLGHLRKEKILKLCDDGRGYLRCVLCKDGIHNHVRVHRLVAETFIPRTCETLVVNHKDGDKWNNCVNNLEWCTVKENIHHADRNGLRHFIKTFPEQRLNEDDVKWIKSNYIKGSSIYGVRPLAKRFGVSNGCIANIVRGRNRKDVRIDNAI